MPNGIVKKSYDEILRDEEIIDIVKAAVVVGISKIRITGGEPMVRKGIYELVKKISNIDGIKEIVLSTNATFLPGNINKLKESGISRVNFSLDSLDPDKIKRITKSTITFDYNKLIKEMISCDMLPIKINVVLLKGINDSEISSYIDLADRYDITVRFIELMPIGHLEFDYSKYFINKDEILKDHPELIFKNKDVIAEYYNVQSKKGQIGFIEPISNKFCDQCDRIRLTADGYLKPCLHENTEIYIKDIKHIDLLEKIKKAVISKPKAHVLNRKGDSITKRPMNKIGG